MYRQQNPLRAISGGIFLIGLALAFWASSSLGGDYFLPILFAALAFSSLFGSLSSFNPRAIYGSLYAFIWLLGLGILFLPFVGFWPWILVLCGLSAILASLARPIMAGLLGLGIYSAASRPTGQPQPTYYQPPQNAGEEVSQAEPTYQEGYRPQPATYQNGKEQYPQPQPKFDQSEYEQPQAQYPQEMPPQGSS